MECTCRGQNHSFSSPPPRRHSSSFSTPPPQARSLSPSQSHIFSPPPLNNHNNQFQPKPKVSFSPSSSSSSSHGVPIPSPACLPDGTFIKLKNLKKRTDLNKQLGKIIKFDTMRDRYEVQLLESGILVRARIDNVQRITLHL